MNRLILVKHSLPQIEPEKPPAEWSLSEEGRQRCKKLADQVARYEQPGHIFSSTETKAKETAALVAESLGTRPEVWEELHEHERRNVPITSEEAYRSAVASLFQNPTDLVYGDETAVQAGERFQQAMLRLLEAKDGKLVVVAHGTVICLFVAAYNRIDPFELWSQLGLPSFVVLSRPERRLLEVVPEV